MRICIPKIAVVYINVVPLYPVVCRMGMGGNDFRVYEPKELRGGGFDA